MTLKKRASLMAVAALLAVAALNVDLIAQTGRMITTTGVVYVRAFMGAFAIQNNAIGTTSTRGLLIENNTAAAAGAQQYSPMLCQEGQGWKTDATAGSQSVEFCWEVQPVQGTSAPTANYILKRSINGGAFSTVGTFTSGGQFITPNGSAANPAIQLGSPVRGFYGVEANSIISVNAGVGALYWNNTQFQVASGMGITWSSGSSASATDLSLSRLGAGSMRVGNATTPTNTYDITLADWGTTLSAEGVSYANGAIVPGPAAGSLGILTVMLSGGRTCEFELVGAGSVVEKWDSGAICSVTQGTPSSFNVSWDAGDNRYELENLLGSTNTVRVTLIGA